MTRTARRTRRTATVAAVLGASLLGTAAFAATGISQRTADVEVAGVTVRGMHVEADAEEGTLIWGTGGVSTKRADVEGAGVAFDAGDGVSHHSAVGGADVDRRGRTTVDLGGASVSVMPGDNVTMEVGLLIDDSTTMIWGTGGATIDGDGEATVRYSAGAGHVAITGSSTVPVIPTPDDIDPGSITGGGTVPVIPIPGHIKDPGHQVGGGGTTVRPLP